MTDDMEAEANLFARTLLMPEQLVRAEIAKFSSAEIGDLLDEHNQFIPKLAKAFGVPPLAMILRLQEIGVIRP